MAKETGQIGWADLTVADAIGIRDFYQNVTGWKHSPFDMGGYEDFMMRPPGSEQPVAGICNRRGTNATLPATWLIYITVANLDDSLQKATERGGKVISGPHIMGTAGRYAIIEDPSGASAGLFEAAAG